MKTINIVFVCILFVGLVQAQLRQNGTKNFGTMFQLPKSPSFVEAIDLKTVTWGTCTYVDVTQTSRLCETIFFQQLIQQVQPNCTNLFKIMQTCMMIAWNQCLMNDTEKSLLTKHGSKIFNSQTESCYCKYGALSLPDPKQSTDYCDTKYYREAKKCVRNYHNRFTRSPSDPRLCGDYLNARRCLYRVQDVSCSNDEPLLIAVIQASRELYRCWNPFCVWRKRRVEDGALSNYAISEEEQMQGIPDDCVSNTASLILSSTFKKLAKTKKQSSIIASPYAKEHGINDDYKPIQQIYDLYAAQETIIDSKTPPGGHANKLHSSLGGCLHFFLAIFFLLVAAE